MNRFQLVNLAVGNVYTFRARTIVLERVDRDLCLTRHVNVIVNFNQAEVLTTRERVMYKSLSCMLKFYEYCLFDSRLCSWTTELWIAGPPVIAPAYHILTRTLESSIQRNGI